MFEDYQFPNIDNLTFILLKCKTRTLCCLITPHEIFLTLKRNSISEESFVKAKTQFLLEKTQNIFRRFAPRFFQIFVKQGGLLLGDYATQCILLTGKFHLDNQFG